MARSRTLVNLRTDVRQRSDMESTTFVADSELTEYINQSIAELYDLLVNVYGDDYYATSTSLTVGGPLASSAPTGTATQPAAFYKLVALEFIDSSSNKYPLRRMRFQDLRRIQTTRSWSSGSLPRYAIVGSSFYFSLIPPNETTTATCWYIPAPTRLTADGDTFDGIAGWEEYVVVDAAAKCLEKEETDRTHLIERKKELERRIVNSAPARDLNDPWVTRDVTADFYDYDWELLWR